MFAIRDLMPMYRAKHCHCFLIKSPSWKDTVKKILYSVSGSLSSSKRPILLNKFTEDSYHSTVRKQPHLQGPGNKINAPRPV